MVKKLFAVLFLMLVPSLLLAQESNIFQGEKKAKSLADAFLLNISYAPTMPANDFLKTKIYAYDQLRPGNVIEGPSVIETRITTIVIPPEKVAKVDRYLNVEILI